MTRTYDRWAEADRVGADNLGAGDDIGDRSSYTSTMRHADPERGSEPVRIGVVAIEGGLTVAVGGLVDVFAVANRWWQVRTGLRERRFQVEVLASQPAEVRSFTGYPFPTDGPLEGWSGDVVLCSAVAVDPVRAVDRDRRLVTWLGEQAGRPGVTLASVCTGAFFLAEAGVLRGLRATTNPLYGRAFAERYPDVRLALSRVVVDEGAVITSGTVAAGLNLALLLVERHAGVEVASLTARALAVDKNRESQASYLIPSGRLEEGDELVVAAQRWIEAHHADPELTLGAVARAMAVSPRTLQRRFRQATADASPLDYLRLVRLEAARRLLERTPSPIDEITWRVGYRDPRSFARLFRAHTELSPSAYRARFGRFDQRS